MRAKFIINNLKQKDKKEGITLAVTFSRLIFSDIFFNALAKMDLPRKDMHLLIYDNSVDPSLATSLAEHVHKLTPEYKSVRLFKSYLKGRGNIRGSGNDVFKTSKLWNIWHMWKKLFVTNGGMIHTPTFFLLEDDTIAPPDAFPKLYKTLMKDKKTAFVTGISTGRAPAPWVPVGLGVHHMKMKGLFCLERHSLNPNTKGIVEVDGSGVYCFVARTEAYKKGFIGYDPIKLNVPFFALDNIMIYNLKTKGYKILADFSIWVSHLQASAARIISFGKNQAVEMYTIWLPQINNYAQGMEVKDKNHKPKRYHVRKFADTWEL